MHNTNPVYRPDIDGLRAQAILSVIVYHAFPLQLRGGFVGVDIFFVISGFLISSILFKSLRHGDFSFIEFYARRVCRIFPALILVFVACYAVGWFVLFPAEFKQLGKHMLAGAGFIQNFVLNSEAGYFDTSSELKPLMHLWSLSIEEQFYLLFPALIWVVWRLGQKAVLALLVVLAMVSFGVNMASTDRDATQAFFMPYTRCWELLSGGVLAYAQLYQAGSVTQTVQRWVFPLPLLRRLPSPEHRAAALNNGFAVLGLLLVLGASVGLDQRTPYPGAWALLPVVGAWLLILAGPGAWLNREILASRVAVFIGRISYPLYLWHWPILSFARILSGASPAPSVRFAVLALSFLLAWLTYVAIEMPLRAWSRIWAKSAALCLAIGLLGAVGFHTAQHGGLGFRAIARLSGSQADDGGDGGNSLSDCGIEDRASKTLFGNCAKDKRGQVRFALLGDSKAAALYPGLVRTSHAGARWMFIGGNGPHGAPVPLLSDDPAWASFQPLIKVAAKTIQENKDIDRVVIVTAIRAIFKIDDGVAAANSKTYDYLYLKNLAQSSSYQATLEAFSATLSGFEKAGKKVTIVVDNPALPAPEDCISRTTSLGFINRLLSNKPNVDCFVPLQDFNAQIALYRKLLDALSRRYPKTVDIFDPTDIYCDSSSGICGPARAGRPLYAYTDHISDYAAGLVGARLNQYLLQQ